MRVVWSPQALDDRDAIWAYIAANNPSAAIRVDADLADAIGGLGDHPELGRPGLIPGTREFFPIHSYRIVYELTRCTSFRSSTPRGSGRGKRSSRVPIT